MNDRVQGNKVMDSRLRAPVSVSVSGKSEIGDPRDTHLIRNLADSPLGTQLALSKPGLELNFRVLISNLHCFITQLPANAAKSPKALKIAR
jgi:hypothetical protein